VTGRIRSTEKSNDLIGNLTHGIPACSIVPQPTMLRHAPVKILQVQIKIKIKKFFAHL
jgi:hypothetical protein